MTESEFLALEPRERDAVIAEKVMGQCVRAASDFEEWVTDDHYINKPDAEEPRWGHMLVLPRYTTSTAWQIVEKMLVDGYDFNIALSRGMADVTIGLGPDKRWNGKSNEAPLAIGLCALKAVGEIE
jgi:hypothetical protein